MGKKAKKAPVQTKKRPTLAKRFKCPFCANVDVVECKMDLRNGTGSLSCRVCSASYSMPIHHLHEPIDVFSEWLDDCEAAERGEVAPASASSRNDNNRVNMSKVVHDTSQDYDDDDESDGLPEPSGLGQKKRPAENKSGGGGSDDDESEGEGEGEGGKAKKQKATTATLGLDESSDDDSD